MNYKFSWYNLPKQIKDKMGFTVLWYNLPKQLDDILEGLSIIKPDCYDEVYPNGSTKFIWYNLPTQIDKLFLLTECVE